MGLLEVFNYGTGNDYYAKKQKELDDKYKTLSVAGGKVDMTINRKTQDIVGPSIPDQKPPGIKIDPIQKNIPFHPSQGGTQQILAQDPKWWEKLAGMANVDMDKAKASWNKKGGFEGLMANPAFTMGLAFMQSAAEGKTLGAGALDNVMKAGGISQHYKQIIKDRKEEPIQATAQDIGEVKTLLKSMNIEEGNWLENLLGGPQSGMKYDAAVEEIAVQFQKEVSDWQKNNKNPDGTPKIIRSTDKIKILNRLVKSGKIIKKENWLNRIGITSGTLQMPLPKEQGGPVQAGKPYVVGEGGPEYFLPQESGKILSNDDSRIFAMLLSANPQLQNVSRTRAEKILRNRFPEYFE